MLMPANESQSNQYCLLQLLGKSSYLYKQKWQTLSNYQKKKKKIKHWLSAIYSKSDFVTLITSTSL